MLETKATNYGRQQLQERKGVTINTTLNLNNFQSIQIKSSHQILPPTFLN